MLNLANVFCLLLAAKATRAQFPWSLDAARNSYDKAMESSLAKIDQFYAQNDECVKKAKSALKLQIDNFESRLELPLSESGNIKLVNAEIMGAKASVPFIDIEGGYLNRIFHINQMLFEKKQHAAKDCTSLGRRQAVSCFNRIRKILPEMVKASEFSMSIQCQVATTMLQNGLMFLLNAKRHFSDP